MKVEAGLAGLVALAWSIAAISISSAVTPLVDHSIAGACAEAKVSSLADRRCGKASCGQIESITVAVKESGPDCEP